jgi:hypothetical protein
MTKLRVLVVLYVPDLMDISNILKDFGFFLVDLFGRLYFGMVKLYLSFHNSSFALRYYFFNVNGKAIV